MTIVLHSAVVLKGSVMRSIFSLLLAGCVSLGAAEKISGPDAKGCLTRYRDTTSVCENTSTRYCYKSTKCDGEMDWTTEKLVDCSEMDSASGSMVDNLSFNYIHDAVDYRTDGAELGCRSCGGGVAPNAAPNGTQLPAVLLTRYFRSRDAGFPSSFGPQNYSAYDISLMLLQTDDGQNAIDLFDPAMRNPYRFYDGLWANPFGISDDRDGIYHDDVSYSARDLVLLQADGSVALDQVTAASAVLTLLDGQRYRFQIIDVESGRAGRITRIEDRNGYGIDIAYRYQPGDDLDGSPSRLWQIASVTDAYGRVATFHYADSQIAGRWVVDRIDPPNHEAISYGYAGNFLASVSLPDGTQSSFTRSFDEATGCSVLSIFDAAADGIHRRKDVYLTTNATVIPDSGYVLRQPAELVRLILDGEGEVLYLNFPHPQYTLTWVYEGGGTMKNVAFGWEVRYAVDWSIDLSAGNVYDAVHADLEPTFTHYDFSSDNNYVDWSRLTPRSMTTRTGHGRPVEYKPRTGFVAALHYDDGTSDHVDRNDFQQVTQHVDRLGHVSQVVYDAQGNRLSWTKGLVLDASGHAVASSSTSTWRWEYFPAGDANQFLLKTAIDANGNRTDYVYDTHHYLTTIIEAPDRPGDARATWSFSYDDAGRVVEVDDPLRPTPRFQKFTYDQRSRRIRTDFSDGSTEQLVYGTGANSNLVTDRIDRNGHDRHVTFDADGRPVREDQPEGLSVETAYLPANNLPVHVNDRGRMTDTDYDYRLRESVSTQHPRADRALTSRKVYANNLLVADVDAYGRAIRFAYDVNDFVRRTVAELTINGTGGQDLDSLARQPAANPDYTVTDDVFDALGNLVDRIDPRGHRTHRTFDEQNRLISEAQAIDVAAESRTTVSTYDAQGNVLTVIGPRQVDEFGDFTTRMTYTGRNLVATHARPPVTNPDGSTDTGLTTYAYTVTRHLAQVIDPLGHQTTYTYLPCCDRLATETDAAGGETSYGYDAVGNITSVTDANGNGFVYAYDGVNRRTHAVNGEAEDTQYLYDDDLSNGLQIPGHPEFAHLVDDLGFGAGAVGSAVVTIDPLGELSVSVLDAAGRQVRMIDALTHARTITYDAVAAGLVETTTADALNDSTRTDADAAGRVRVSFDALGAATHTSFDANGNRVSVRDPNGTGFDAAFDALNHVTARTDTHGDTAAWTFDRSGNVTSVTNGLGHRRRYAYDARDRLVAMIDGLSGVTLYAYDAADRRSAVSDAEHGTTSYDYDARNLVIAQHFPSPTGGQRAYRYDPGRRLIERTDQAGATTSYLYDRANRLVHRAYSSNGGTADDFAFDHAGRLVSAASSRYGTNVSRAFDPAGHIQTESETVLGTTYTIGYSFDAGDRLIALTYPSGHVVSRTYTPRDQLRQVAIDGDLVADREYDDGGRLTTTRFGNGVTESRSYRTDNLVDHIVSPGVEDLSIGYDAGKRKVFETNALAPTENQDFTYDDEDRLVLWHQDGQRQQQWDLTLVGDWRSTDVSDTATGASRHESRTHTPVHEISSVAVDGAAPMSVENDAKGNLTFDPESRNRFSWDDENRLATATTDAPGSVSYLYDALGRRLAKVIGGQTTTSVCAGAQIIEEYDQGAVPRSYAYGSYDDEALVLATGQTKTYFHLNNLYSVVALSSGSGAVIERYRYDAYGKWTVLTPAGDVRGDQSAVGNTIGFTGQRVDVETGLVYCWNRWLSPSLGRFLNRDPIGYVDGMSLYAAYFVPNYVDPDGRIIPILIAIGEIGGAIIEEELIRRAAIAAAQAAAVYAAAYATCCAMTELLSKLSHGISDAIDRWSQARALANIDGPDGNDTAANAADFAASLLDTLANALERAQQLACPLPDDLKDYTPKEARKKAGDLRKEATERRESSKKLRKKWEQEHNEPWPKDPKTGRNQDVSHKKALADHGTNDVDNLEPKPHDDHMKEHMDNGDFKRWGSRSGQGNSAGTGSGEAGAGEGGTGATSTPPPPR